MAIDRHIHLRGVHVHNLKHIDLDVPRGRLVVLCGLSGSGKSSLAFDTLYAEGQRRYIESFSAYTRQFLERLEKPAAERIDGLPPAIAVTHTQGSRSNRSTVGTATELNDYLRLLFAKIGHVVCRQCRQTVRRDSAESTAEFLFSLPAGARYLVAFPVNVPCDSPLDDTLSGLRDEGFVRAIQCGLTLDLANLIPSAETRRPLTKNIRSEVLHIVVDRLSAGASPQRVRDSVETAFARGDGRCVVFLEAAAHVRPEDTHRGTQCDVDGRPWWQLGFSNRFRCDDCNFEYATPEPRLFSFNSPLGACPTCKGFGNILDLDMDLIVPDREKSLRQGAIAPWNAPAYAHELKELLALSSAYGIPVDVPFRALGPEQVRLISEGVSERGFGGLRGFFDWLTRRKYKVHIRAFLSRWRSERVCPACQGSRLQPGALDARIEGATIADICRMKVCDAAEFFRRLQPSEWEQTVGQTMLQQVQLRLSYLAAVGLDYLTLDRTLRTLSGGESQRVALASALGTSLVNMLYVLDEPSVGLHPHDTGRMIDVLLQLRDRGNSLVVVEHDEAVIRAADWVVEIGPGAGERGGQVVFQGTVTAMQAAPQSLTGDFLAGRRGAPRLGQRRVPNHGWIRLAGAKGNNLQNLTAEFPLGLLCVVTGVSGSGKSTLVQDTLYPALCRRLRKTADRPLPFDDVYGDGQIEDCLLVDQSPIGRSPRTNPVTYIKAFDEIRAVFAETIAARTHNYTASHFSFNSAQGRCPACEGVGYHQIDMQFLADVFVPCSDCEGTRYRGEILQVTHRGINIAEVLQLTVREAFAFFRGQRKVQARLKGLMDVGLDYLRLGQPANTLSGGESQRLKLASYLSSARRSRTLFILDEPTTGLHFADVAQLLDCFEALLAVGHSLIVVEHNVQLMLAADYLIDLGPGAADAGGQIVAQGTPELVAREATSPTAQTLAHRLATAAAAGGYASV